MRRPSPTAGGGVRLHAGDVEPIQPQGVLVGGLQHGHPLFGAAGESCDALIGHNGNVGFAVPFVLTVIRIRRCACQTVEIPCQLFALVAHTPRFYSLSERMNCACTTSMPFDSVSFMRAAATASVRAGTNRPSSTVMRTAWRTMPAASVSGQTGRP